MHFSFATAVVALATWAAMAAPHDTHADGRVIKISKRSLLVNDDNTVNIEALKRHTALVKGKILRGSDAFEKNTGMTYHPTAKDIQRRGDDETLIDSENLLWYGNVSVGTPPVTFKVDFDTGSSDFFLSSSTCGETCKGHKLWDPSSSSTAHRLGPNFILKFGDSSTVSGEEYNDTVRIGDLTATNQTLGAVTALPSSFQSYKFPVDGLMGMGFRSISVYNATPFFQTLVSQKKVTEAVFSFKLSRSGAELFLGGSNRALYKGDFSYAPVTHEGFWQVNLDDIRSNGDKILSNVPAIIDTGTSIIVGPPSNVSALYSALGGEPAPSIVGNGYHTFPCEAFPTVSLTFGGESFEIPASALNLGPLWYDQTTCVSSIVSLDVNLPVWVIGDTFLRSVYTTFDVEKSRVGFARLA